MGGFHEDAVVIADNFVQCIASGFEEDVIGV